MNSSGIKRGLAASAVAALAVAGIPALATSASAAVGDSFTVVSTGPALNGANAAGEGALVTIRFKDGTITPASLATAGTTTDAVNSEDTGSQTVGTVTAGAPYNDPADATYDFLDVRIPVTTPAPGQTATFRLFENDGANAGALEASEARQQVSIKTGGPVAGLAITPNTQTSPEGIPSGNYTLQLLDQGNNPTQLAAAETVDLTASGVATVTDGSGTPQVIDSTEAAGGSATFKAQAATQGAYILTADVTGANPAQATATLQVVKAAGTFAEDEIDIVTQADGWTGFGGGPLYNLSSKDVPVRVDQGTIRIDIASADPADAGAVVAFTLTGTDVTFGGKTSIPVTTTLNAQGKGSITITPDAGSIDDTGDSIDIDGHGLDMQLDFARGKVSTVNSEANLYVSKLDGSVDITVVATDQFGLPAAGVYVDAQRAGQNNDAAPTAKKVTNAQGEATFTFTDANAINNGTDTVTFRVFADQFSATPIDPDGDLDYAEHFDTATIRYTTEGTGSEYVLNLDGLNASGVGYDPASVTVMPLSDTDAGAPGAPVLKGDEAVNLGVVGGDTGAPVTISVDNGAKILKNAEQRLSQGADSETDVIGSGNTFRIVGTKSGLVTVTVKSGGLTHTAQFTVTGGTDARNVTVSGPAQSAAGSLATFTAVVTDAFGNPVANVPAGTLGVFNVQVTGPGALQDTGAATDATGSVALNVRLQDDAEGPVTIKVTGLPGYDQFGADADELNAGSGADTAVGLPASANVSEATVTAVAPPVDDEPVNPQLNVTGKGGGKDRIKADAISDAAGAKATLWVKGKKVKSGTLNSAGNFVFKVKDKNGNKSTRYVVKISGTTKTLGARDSVRVR